MQNDIEVLKDLLNDEFIQDFIEPIEIKVIEKAIKCMELLPELVDSIEISNDLLKLHHFGGIINTNNKILNQLKELCNYG